jgi:hypothetical protein
MDTRNIETLWWIAFIISLIGGIYISIYSYSELSLYVAIPIIIIMVLLIVYTDYKWKVYNKHNQGVFHALMEYGDELLNKK